MIFVTGDCHQNYGKLTLANFPEQMEMTKEDYVIVCGDFGYIFSGDKLERQVIDFLATRRLGLF